MCFLKLYFLKRKKDNYVCFTLSFPEIHEIMLLKSDIQEENEVFSQEYIFKRK